MLPSATSQAPAIFPLPGMPPSAMPAAAATAAVAADEEIIFGIGADEAFFSSIPALMASPPPPSPPSFHRTSPDLRWPSTNEALATAISPPSTGATADTLDANTGLAFDGSRAAAEDPFSPLLAVPPPTTTSGQSLGPPSPLLLPGSSAGSEGQMTPVDVLATGMPPPPPPPPLPPPPAVPPPLVAPAASRAKKAPGLSKPRAKGGGIRQKRSKSNTSSAAAAAATTAAAARREAGLEDGEPDKKVCLLAVGRSNPQQLARSAADAGSSGGGSSSSSNGSSSTGAASSRVDLVNMLTVEMGRNGRELETEHADTGQRAVTQMKALAGLDMRYGMVVLEVEDSLDAAAEVARELRAANRTTPIVAVTPPHLFRDPAPPLAKMYLNEILQFPVSAAQVRFLATRWLLPPPSIAGAAATSGMAGETVDPDPTAWVTATRYAGSSDGISISSSSSSSSSATVTTLVSPSLPAGGGAPTQQQQQQQGERGVPASAPSCGSSVSSAGGGASLASTSSRAPDVLTKPRASMPTSSPLPSTSTSTTREGERLPPPPITGRIFGGGAEDRESPCRLFGQDFERQNAEMEAREYDFMFRHGTIVLKVEEDELGEMSAEVFSACEYATAHFGSITGKPLESLFAFPATNEKTAGKILAHIKKSDTDSMCSYINLKSETRWMTSSFVSVRSLSKKPERGPGRERLPPWYVIVKICLPSTLGLVKEPELLQHMYSKRASEDHKNNKGSRNAAPKRGAKKAKVTPADDDDNNTDNADGIAGGAYN